jgi:hypothetical protein
VTPLEHIMGLMDPSYSEPVRRSMAQSILDKHAHELAEKIRAERGTTSLENGHHFFSGMDFAADLIDPKAQRASTEGDTP